MKLIINAVNLRIGGALQRSLSFLNELKEINNDYSYFVFYNRDIDKQIDINSFPPNFKFFLFENSPAHLLRRWKIVKRFDSLEKEIKPDIVFSFANPCYWKAKSPHLVGFTLGHIVYSDYKYVQNYSLKIKLEMLYKKFWTKYEADYFVVQTEDVRQRLAQKFNISTEKIFLVSNGIGEQFNDRSPIKNNRSEIKKMLLVSTFRPSKNFDIIREIIPFLQNDIFKYEFHITITPEDFAQNFKGFEESVINHGHVKAADCPALYNEADAMFLPSHLECFSASYPEAMKMEKPILTSDLSFAHTVCGDSALYFDNLSPEDAAQKIKKLFHNESIYNDLVEKGKNQLLKFDSSREQAEKYLEICNQICKA
jgi:glycosyltransferase involved in cell wall biosynthesis